MLSQQLFIIALYFLVERSIALISSIPVLSVHNYEAFHVAVSSDGFGEKNNARYMPLPKKEAISSLTTLQAYLG